MSYEQERDAVLALPDHLRDALWKIEMAQLKTDGGADGDRRRHGRLGDRRRPRGRGARRPADEAAADRARLRAALLGRRPARRCSAPATRARPRRRSRSTRRPRRWAPSGSSPPPAASWPSWRARDGVPVIGLPAGPAAARRGRLHVRGRGRARRAGAGRAADPHRDRRAPPRRWRSAARRCPSAPSDLAAELEGTIPVFYGADLTAPVAYRWKCEVNENAKLPAFNSRLPEAEPQRDLAGGEGPRGARSRCVLLADCRPAPARAPALRADREAGQGPRRRQWPTVEAEGETRTARLLELVMLGDLLSLELAQRRRTWIPRRSR